MTPSAPLLLLALLLSFPVAWVGEPAAAEDFVRTTGGGGGSFNRFPSRAPEPVETEDAGSLEAAPAEAAAAEPAPGPAAPAAEPSETETAAEDEDEDEDPVPERTLGKACIYGPRGQVLYQPEGKGCSGPGAVPTAVADETGQEPAQTHCMFADDGQLLFAPPGADCQPRQRRP